MNEFVLNATLEYEDSEETELSLQCPTDLVKSIASKRYSRNKVSVGIERGSHPARRGGPPPAGACSSTATRPTTSMSSVGERRGDFRPSCCPRAAPCFLYFGSWRGRRLTGSPTTRGVPVRAF
jgi:hypothetical protein